MIKFIRTSILAGLVVVTGYTAPVQAANPPKLERFAVINIQKVLRLSQATKAIKPQIQSLRDRFQSQIRQREQALKTENTNLQRERSVLAPEAYEQKRRGFQSRITALQSDVQGLRRRLDVAGRNAMAQVNVQFRQIAAQIAKEKNLQVIIPRSTAIYVENAFDITDEVLKRLDQRLPSVQVTMPPEQGGTGGAPARAR